MDGTATPDQQSGEPVEQARSEQAGGSGPAVRSGPAGQVDLRLLHGRDGHGGLVLSLRVVPAAALIAAVQLLITASRLSRSWWWQDDLNLLATAARRPLTPGLLFSNYNGHLIPGSWALAWLFDRVAPLQWWPAALVTLLMVAAIDLMMLALLRRLFGDRPAILLPYAMFCGTSLTITATLWWAAALQWLPVTLSLVTALWFHVGYLRGRRRSDAIGALAAVVFGLAFFEKALTTPLVLALFTVGYGVAGPLWRRPWRAFRGYWPYWLAHAALAGGFVGLYLSRVTVQTGQRSSRSDVIEVARLMIFDTLLPSLIGGPLRWFTGAGTVNAWPNPAPPLVLLATALTVLAVVGSLLLVAGAWRAWVLLAVFLGVSVTLVAWARLGFIGPFIGRDHRYLTDAAVMVPLCVALAWLPLHGDQDVALTGADALSERRAARRAVASGWAQRHPEAITGAAVGAVLVMTLGGLVSGEQFMHNWTRNPSQAYLSTLSAGLAAHPGPVYLFDDEVAPDLVMQPTFLADRRLGHLTRPMRVRPVTGTALPSFSVVDDQGRLHAGTIHGYTAVVPKHLCAQAEAPTTVRLPVTPSAAIWKLQFGYLANRQTTARLSIGANAPVTMRLERGLHDVYVSIQAGGSPLITLDGLDPGASVCVGGAVLGFPVAAS